MLQNKDSEKMETVELREILGEIKDVFAKHHISKATEMVGVVESFKHCILMSSTIDGMRAMLAKKGVK